MHKKKVGDKFYYYTTVREGTKTKSVYLGSTKNKAQVKEKQLKQKVIVKPKRSFKSFILSFGVFSVMTLLFFATMVYFDGLNITGNAILDVDLALSANAFMMVDGVIVDIPIAMTQNEIGGWYYDLNKLDLSNLNLQNGRHIIDIYDYGKLVYSDVLVVN